MKKNILITLILFIAITQLAFLVVYSNGIEGYTNSPGEDNCTSCHVTYPLNSGGGGVAITIPACANNVYITMQTYTVNVTIKQSGVRLFGFDVEALDSTGNNAGTLSLINAGTTVIANATVNGHIRTNVTHYGGIYSTDSCTFSFKWTAPSSYIGKVNFYVAANASNGDGSMAGDYIYSSSLQINPDLNAGILQNKLPETTVRIYPNPANNLLFIGMNQADKAAIDVFDEGGKQVIHTNINNASFLNIAGLSEGIYTLIIHIASENIEKKFVVTR